MVPDAVPRRLQNERGYLTLTALSLTTVISISLASYISLCYQSYLLSYRLFQVAQCRQLAETGLEEALWALNNNTTTGWTANAGPGSNVAWTVSGSTQNCTITGYQLGEGATGQVAITVTNYNCPFNPPPAPAPSPTPTIAATAVVTLPTGAQLTKTLSAPFKPAPLFPNAIGITPDNGGILQLQKTSTFCSCAPPPAVFGGPSSYAATLAAPTIDFDHSGTHAITAYGYAANFANSGALVSNSNSSLSGPTSPTSPKIDPSRINASAFVPMYTIAEPSAALFGTHTLPPPPSPPAIGTPGATELWYTSLTGDLWVDGVGSAVNYSKIQVQGHVILVVLGRLGMPFSSTGYIEVLPNSQLEIFVRGDTVISQGGGFLNDTGSPKNLVIYGAAYPHTFTYNSGFTNPVTGVSFCGTIYSAGSISFTVSPAMVIYGAILSNSNVTFAGNGGLQFYYDRSLLDLPMDWSLGVRVPWFAGVKTPFILLQVTES
jgi:hypothetical protein